MKELQDEIIETLKSFKDSIPHQINYSLDDIVPKKVNEIVQKELDRNDEFLKGPQGFRGPQGPRGFEGPQGLRGISIKEIALTENNNLTVQLSDGKSFYFKQSLKGDKGEQGIQGEKGEKGTRGQRGKIGPRGESAPLQYQGEWRQDRSYNRADIVSYQQGLWIATRDNNSRPSAENDDWDLMISLPVMGPRGGSSSQAVSATVDPWVGARFYPEHSTVTFNYKLYIARNDHTATLDFAADYAAGNWATETGVPLWTTATAYAANNVVTINGYVYVCLIGHTSANFATDLAAGRWQESEKGVPVWETAIGYSINDVVIEPTSNDLYSCLAVHTSGTFATDLAAGFWKLQNDKGIKVWATATNYAVDDVVIFESVTYVCKLDHTSNIFRDELNNGNTWEKQKQVPAWQDSDFPYFIDDVVTESGIVYLCLANHQSNDFATELGLNFWRPISEPGVEVWATATTYSEFDVVIEPSSHLIYTCTTGHTSTNFATDLAAGNWEAPDAGISLWASGISYDVSDAVIFNSEIYIALTAHTSATFLTELNAGNWLKQKQVPPYVDGGYSYFIDDVVTEAGEVYLVTVNFVSTNFAADLAAGNLRVISENAIDLWQTATLYNINDVIIDGPNNDIYVCAIAHTSTVFATDKALNRWKATFPSVTNYDSYIELLPAAANVVIPGLDFDLNDTASAVVDVIIKRKTDVEEIVSKSVLYVFALETTWEGTQEDISFIRGGVDGVTFSFTQATDNLQVRYTSTTLAGTHNPDQSRLEYIVRSEVRRV
jgi:hypothetical protein